MKEFRRPWVLMLQTPTLKQGSTVTWRLLSKSKQLLREAQFPMHLLISMDASELLLL